MSTLHLSAPELQQLSAQALETFWQHSGEIPCALECERHIATVANVLYFNIRSDRWLRIMGNVSNPGVRRELLREYALRVARGYEQQHVRVHQLERGEGEAWQSLRERLIRKAYYVLHRRLNLPPRAACKQAEDHAQYACEAIYRRCFPYDVHFDAWAARIVINSILGRLRSPDMLDNDRLLDAEVQLPLMGQVDLVTGEGDWEERWLAIEDHNALWSAFARLPETYQLVLERTFVDGWEAQAIADVLEKSPQAVYNLRRRALERLAVLLDAEDFALG